MTDAERQADDTAGGAVIDASVAVKWVVAEAGTDAALRLRQRLVASRSPIYVPDLFWAETANVLWRRTRGRDRTIDPAEAGELLEVLRAAPLATDPIDPIAGRALEIACATGISAYDAMYVVVAEVRGARLWTADDRLVRSLEGSEWAGLVSSLA